MTLKIQKDKVLEAADKCPEAKKTLQILFPQIFEDNTPFAFIGQLLIRKSCPNNFYAIQKHNGHISLLNITHSSYWSSSKMIPIGSLKDFDKKVVTVSEFRELTGKDPSEFSIIPITTP